jgi:Protein of unknown function with PCYCGC motif
MVTRAGKNNSATPANMVAENAGPAVESTPRVPAFQSSEQARKLGPTLEPKQFFGKAREAYQVAKKIPQTLAQLPCYCHCDQSFGHKSLHTCFEDDHASHCAVCVDEALLAYELQTQQNLSPEQVRNMIIEKYSAGHDHAH